jgi:hypothetical protein
MATIELPDLDTLDAFLDALAEVREAEEFERLMGETEAGPSGERFRPFNESMARIKTQISVMHVHHLTFDLGVGDEPSALTQLKARRALDALREQYPEQWDRAATRADEAA